MSIFWQIVIALLILNLLVMVHELGHYVAARIFKVRIKEFAIGMGPAIFKKQCKHNVFSLRAFPIGGFLSMEGEDEESDDPDSFTRKKAWQKFIVVCSGAVMNLLLGLLLTAILVISEPGNLASRKVDVFFEDAISCDYGLRQGDELLKIDSTRITVYSDAIYALTLNETGEADILVRRNGEKLLLENVKFATDTTNGMSVSVRDFYFMPEEKNFVNVVSHSFTETVSLGKVIFRSLVDLVRGKYSMQQVSGPVGTVEIIGQAASQGILSLIYLSAFITVNLGIFNLLPLPALDGGRLIFIIVEMIRGKPVPVKYEGIVHFVGFVLLIILIVVVTFNDIKGLIVRDGLIALKNFGM